MKHKFILTMFVLVIAGSNFANAQSVETAREKFKKDWATVISGKRVEFNEDTMVVGVRNTANPFRYDPDAFAREYHPRTVNGQTCAQLGIKYIQVRNIQSWKFLSGISC